MKASFKLSCILILSIILAITASANKVVVYWGQNSSGNEKSLATYCQDSTIDIIVIGFVYEFPTTGSSSYPAINVANHCWKTFSSSDPLFLDCGDSVGVDIAYCQSQGKQVILSFGGAVGTYGFSSDSQATAYATTVWNMFLGGTSTYRPFGTAVFDGIDLDIEGGSPAGYPAFIAKLRTYFTSQSLKTYYISSAPQCVYPDAYMGPGASTALSSAWFDYVWVQFYNNYCGINAYPTYFNFNVWAAWAATSMNPNVKVFIGAPASSAAAGSGYISAATLKTLYNAVNTQYGSVLGGIMLWDAGQSDANGNYAASIAAFVHTSTSTSSTTSASATVTTSARPIATTGARLVATTGATRVATTGSARTVTTGARSITSGIRSTTGRLTASTTGRISNASGGTKSSTTGAKIVTGTASTSTSGSASTTCSNDGYMRCATSETFQTCTHGLWSVQQSCSVGLVCSPSGNYIYCNWPSK